MGLEERRGQCKGWQTVDNIARRLAARMADKKVSQAKLAKAAGVNQTTISNTLLGKSTLRANNLLVIAEALETDACWLLTGTASVATEDPLLDMFGRLRPEDQSIVRDLVSRLAKNGQ